MQTLLDIAKNNAQKIIPQVGNMIATGIKNPQGMGQAATDIGIKSLTGLGKDVINNLPIDKENKQALTNMQEALIQKIPMKGPGGVRPPTPDISPNPSTKIGFVPPAHKLSGWDSFKNTLSKLGEKIGLKTHLITPEDYVWSKKDKDGNPIDGGKYVFDWKVARENDKKNNRPTETGVDLGKLISTGISVAKMVKGG